MPGYPKVLSGLSRFTISQLIAKSSTFHGLFIDFTIDTLSHGHRPPFPECCACPLI